MSSLFFRTAILIAIAGVALGIFMGINQDFRLAHMHAHLNLLGWVSFFLFGGFYHLVPSAAIGALPRLHYGFCLVGLVIFITGLSAIALDSPVDLTACAAIGSLLLLAGFAMFGWIVFRAKIAPRQA